jgi:hypothetical protein
MQVSAGLVRLNLLFGIMCRHRGQRSDAAAGREPRVRHLS